MRFSPQGRGLIAGIVVAVATHIFYVAAAAAAVTAAASDGCFF